MIQLKQHKKGHTQKNASRTKNPKNEKQRKTQNHNATLNAIPWRLERRPGGRELRAVHQLAARAAVGLGRRVAGRKADQRGREEQLRRAVRMARCREREREN